MSRKVWINPCSCDITAWTLQFRLQSKPGSLCAEFISSVNCLLVWVSWVKLKRDRHLEALMEGQDFTLNRGSMWSVIDQWLISDWSVIDQWLISADGIRSWAEVYDTGYFTVGTYNVFTFGGGTTLVVTGKICFMVSLTLCFILCWGEYESNDISSWLFDQFELF